MRGHKWRAGALCAVCGIAALVGALVLPVGAADFADPAFGTQWRAGEAITPNFWGPVGAAKTEQYLYSGTNRTRLVQYFDKGRMERYDGVTNTPDVKVTNGLLATELITGQIQIADDQFMPKASPAIPIAGDVDGTGPTYATLAGKANSLLAPAQSATGTRLSTGITPAGDATGGVIPANPGTQLSAYDGATKHNVTQAFADYRTSVGLANIGYAKSEPFATSVKVAGKTQDVVIQVFERRVLTYTASNAAAFQVEFGNIGQHYFQWRYQTPDAATAVSTALTTTTPTATAVASTAKATVAMPSGPTPTATAPPTTQGPVIGANMVCPSGYPLKANPATKQYLIFGQKGYDTADASACFSSIVAVEAAGYMRTVTGFSGN